MSRRIPCVRLPYALLFVAYLAGARGCPVSDAANWIAHYVCGSGKTSACSRRTTQSSGRDMGMVSKIILRSKLFFDWLIRERAILCFRVFPECQHHHCQFSGSLDDGFFLGDLCTLGSGLQACGLQC